MDDLKKMFEHSDDAPPAIPAATLVIFRNAPDGGAPQLLMVQRSKEMRFAGGAAVFPGGRVDEADRVLAAALIGASQLLPVYCRAPDEDTASTALPIRFAMRDHEIGLDDQLDAVFFCARSKLEAQPPDHHHRALGGWRLDRPSDACDCR